MGLLLIQDHGEKEMIRFAFGLESLVHSVVFKARKKSGFGLNLSVNAGVTLVFSVSVLTTFTAKLLCSAALSSFSSQHTQPLLGLHRRSC
ncbi:hypothetical protein Vadar_009226 [Vaccinium darrowii]|uniref:Uncharacterized protein n=1 Tax=Vaccinium darrowii TaxID=229202 RepID=A0ACB7ZIV6_9ERIC|nr:hypothetical protein Vadar_009226 [Vaccinium darrowii]